MTEIQVVEVDERDCSWEDEHPRFRVYIHGSQETSTSGSTAAYDVTGADVLQVIDWAQTRASGNDTYAIALVVDDDAQEALNPGHGRGLVWILGTDGNSTNPGGPTAQAQRRMLRRRSDPVVLPDGDRMPRVTVRDLPPVGP